MNTSEQCEQGLLNTCACRAETLPEPRAGDAWVLRHILHDWNDADAARILATLRAAIGAVPVTLCLVEVEALRVLGALFGAMCRNAERSEGPGD